MKVRILCLMIAAAAMARLLPHPFNFTPIGAMGLFGAAFFDRKWMGLAVPFAALFLTDLFLNNVVYGSLYHSLYGSGFVWFTTAAWTIYLGFAAYFLIGKLVFASKIGAKQVAVAAVAGSLVFFLLTNFGAWMTDAMYPKTPAGLGAAMAAGLPFLGNTVAGDLCFSGLLFGSLYLLKKQVPQLA